ncbi:hypothetical protein AB0H63_08115 [Micromonospora echinospora]|uniref:Uncharacterized protein n=1 Tax=Micromonospora echinospora TaxID=1877 RepID=A0A1C4WYA9_MICEC|nr:hypothetical protein [Micromonospora echinospora]SCF01257.1 hypothetical protein GA0070618_2612 [Micromonospora echinospora]
MPVFLKKLLIWGGVAFLIYFMAFRPQGAAEMFKAIGAALMAIAAGLGDFLSSLLT